MNKDTAQKQRDIFADNLQYYLNLRGKQQSDLSQILDVSSSTVSDWYNAKKYPRVDKMQMIADYLGVLMSNLREENTFDILSIPGIISKEAQKVATLYDKANDVDKKIVDLTLEKYKV